MKLQTFFTVLGSAVHYFYVTEPNGESRSRSCREGSNSSGNNVRSSYKEEEEDKKKEEEEEETDNSNSQHGSGDARQSGLVTKIKKQWQDD